MFKLSSIQSLSFAVGAVGFVGLSSVLGASSAEAAIINGSFNSGFSSWQTTGVTSVTGGVASLNTNSGSSLGALESFLGLAPGTIGTIGSSPTNGSAIKQSFFATAGDVVSFDWQFLAGDNLPYNDFAFTTLSSAAQLLSDVSIVGDFGDSGLQTFSWLIPTTGTYTLGLGVMNSLDSVVNSILEVDNVAGGSTAVPTPALLPGLLGLGVAALRKRKSEGSETEKETVGVNA